jgi:hypothetical protein
MGSIPEGSNIDSRELLRQSALQKKCGTCRNCTVKPPEVELAQRALPIGMCAPGVHCLGGAVRGTCTALGVMVESTDLGPNMKCGGRQYVAGGPSVLGTVTPADQARGAQAYGSFSSIPAAPAALDSTDGTWVALAAVAAIPGISWLVDRLRR